MFGLSGCNLRDFRNYAGFCLGSGLRQHITRLIVRVSCTGPGVIILGSGKTNICSGYYHQRLAAGVLPGRNRASSLDRDRIGNNCSGLALQSPGYPGSWFTDCCILCTCGYCSASAPVKSRTIVRVLAASSQVQRPVTQVNFFLPRSFLLLTFVFSWDNVELF